MLPPVCGGSADHHWRAVLLPLPFKGPLSRGHFHGAAKQHPTPHSSMLHPSAIRPAPHKELLGICKPVVADALATPSEERHQSRPAVDVVGVVHTLGALAQHLCGCSMRGRDTQTPSQSVTHAPQLLGGLKGTDHNFCNLLPAVELVKLVKHNLKHIAMRKPLPPPGPQTSPAG